MATLGDKVRMGGRVGEVTAIGSGDQLGLVAVRIPGRRLAVWVRGDGLTVIAEPPPPPAPPAPSSSLWPTYMSRWTEA